MCGKTGRLELHHKDPHGTDDDSNLILLCPEHHREAEEAVTVHINVRKHSLADALLIVRRRYAEDAPVDSIDAANQSREMRRDAGQT